jgi:S1-C subfamily serine protease
MNLIQGIIVKIFVALGTLAILASCAPQNKDTQSITTDDKVTSNVIYGSDGRLDVYQLTDDRLKKLADSTVALVRSSDLSQAGSVTNIIGKNFGTEMNLCSSEKFREQDTAAFCSGSLVGPDLVLTAGHCIETLPDCNTTSLVFGFAVKSVGVLPKQVESSEVYKCKEIVKTIRNNSGQDFAVIRLNRPVVNHAVLQLRQSGEMSVGDGLVVIGHPVGLPTKITTGGKVRSIANAEYLVASVDTYGGNSGSAVFNAQTGLIEGILVRGEQDFQSQGNCTVSKVCTEDSCRGEDITRISMARSFIPNSGSGGGATPPPSPVLKPEVFSSAINKVIPDNNAQGISSTLQVSSAPQGRKVFVNVDIAHPYIGDLSVQVIAPNGTSIVVHSRAGARTVDLKKSYDVTSSLGKVSSAGVYKIIVKDLAAQDVGSLKSWGIELK